MADMDSTTVSDHLGNDDDLVSHNERQEEIAVIREWSDAVEADRFAYGLSLETQGISKQYAIRILLEEIDRLKESKP